MNLLSFAASISRQSTEELALSALPNAPVVPHVARAPRPATRSRLAVARVLQRAADAVTPAEYLPLH
ncbi:MAG: hypothetical protein QOJ60_328 [Actinomycetota bacterium]|jgi:hypothetical protein|nr:hypothetical protein [Actinomycetota bacterium]